MFVPAVDVEFHQMVTIFNHCHQVLMQQFDGIDGQAADTFLRCRFK